MRGPADGLLADIIEPPGDPLLDIGFTQNVGFVMKGGQSSVMTAPMNVEEFRSQLVVWLDDNDLTPPSEQSPEGNIRQFARVQRALYDAGWSRYGWPERAGGLGGPEILRAIVGEEVVGRRLAEPGPYSMLEALAPTVIDYARPELVAEMVPRLLSGQELWCQGFSEPGSGSDLASPTTRAVQDADADRYIVNGQQMWTPFARYARRCILLARTGDADTPNHEAFTAFFVDVDTPGINVRPPRTDDVDELCDVHFDDVAVPESHLLGKPGDGWRLAMDLLPYERSGSVWQRVAYLYSRLDVLISDVKDLHALGPASDADLGAAYLALHTLRCRSRATQHRLADGHKPGPGTSIDKVLLAGAEQQLYDTARDLLPGVIELDDTDWRTEYLYSRAATSHGGSAEAQRNIIARRLLDLGKE